MYSVVIDRDVRLADGTVVSTIRWYTTEYRRDCAMRKFDLQGLPTRALRREPEIGHCYGLVAEIPGYSDLIDTFATEQTRR